MKIRVLLLTLLLAAPAIAATPNDWVECGTENNAPSGQNRLGSGGHICYLFDDNHGAWPGTSVFHVLANQASCNLVRDVNSTGGAVVLQLLPCPTGMSTYSTSTCGPVLKTFSADDTHNITRGSYMLNATTPVGATEDAVFSCRGY